MKRYLRRVTLAILSLFIISGAVAQNVGVGTVYPDYPFTVRVDGQGIAQDAADSSTSIGFYVVPHFAYLQTNTKDNLLFSTNNGAIQMILDTLGRVGIGVLAPQAKLDVSGSARLRIGTPVAGQVLTTDASGNATWQTTAPSSTAIEYDMVGSNIAVPYINNGTKSQDTLSFTNRFYDPALLFDGTYYTAPSNGLYHFDVNILWGLVNLPSPYTVYISLATNSQIAQSITTVPANLGGNMTSALTANIVLTAGEKTHVELTQNASNAAAISAWSGSFTTFSCHKIY